MQTSKVEKINVDIIDDPAVPVRTRTDDRGLADLGESIRTNGLIQPVILKKRGDRYEVVAGHRRLQAHRLIRKTHIEAIIKDYTDEEAESAKVHENLFREDVNPVDQAMFLARYVERTKADLKSLSRMLNRTEEWVSSRLEILQYPDYLIQEVRDGRISLGVAKLLGQIENEKVSKEYVRFATLQGINIRTAKRWKDQAARGALPDNPADVEEGEDIMEKPAELLRTKCIICSKRDPVAVMETDFVHPRCRVEMAEAIDSAEKEKGGLAPHTNE